MLTFYLSSSSPGGRKGDLAEAVTCLRPSLAEAGLTEVRVCLLAHSLSKGRGPHLCTAEREL